MGEILYQFTKQMVDLVSLQLQTYGSLKRLSCRCSEETSRFIDEVIDIITTFFKDNPKFKMYNVKIFVEDTNIESRRTIPISAKCYNFLLVNTDFSSQNLLKMDMNYDHFASEPVLSRYLFLQIIWHSESEDLLVESLAHVPLDLCVEILEIIIKHMDELKFSRANSAIRLIFLLIYKIYNRCLWLHLGTLSEQNVAGRINELIMYFEMFCCLLVSPTFVTPHNLSMEKKSLRRSILVKDTLYYIRKCMHSKIESYSENHNLATSFTLTYGNFNEHMNYHHIVPVNEVKSIVTRFDQQLATLLLKQIKDTHFESMFWMNIDVNDASTTFLLQHAVVTQCHYFVKFMRQNEFLVTNEDLFHCLERIRRRFVNPRMSNEPSILTLPELCRNIGNNRLFGMKELIKRYKEWDLSTLDFINERLVLLDVNDCDVVLEYLHYAFACLHYTDAEKYQLYMSVLKILIRQTKKNMHSIVQNYVERHFDDNNPLEYLYNEKCFKEFREGILNDLTPQKFRIFLIFILLNPKKVLSELVMYEISPDYERVPGLMFDEGMNGNLDLIRSYYSLNKDNYNILLYILKDIVFKQRMGWCTRLTNFLESTLEYQMINADIIMNELYITYLAGSCFGDTIYVMLSHMYSILKRDLCTSRTNFVLLTIALIKTASLSRRYDTSSSRDKIFARISEIYKIMSRLRKMRRVPEKSARIDLYNSCGMEPLELNMLLPAEINILHIIQQYERRCLFVHQRLRTDPQCHPKLRSYVQSFNLDREAFIRHIILHCMPCSWEHATWIFEMTFIFSHHFGWLNVMMAYENIMRIAAEALQIAVTYAKTSPRNMAILCLTVILAMMKHSTIMESNMLDDYKAVRHVQLKTLSSLNVVISRTPYGTMYKHLLDGAQSIDQSMPRLKYFDKIYRLINSHSDYITTRKDWPAVSPENNSCTNCNNRHLYCKCHGSPTWKKIATMYNAELFIRECIKLTTAAMHRCSERLLHNLGLER